ncbi:CubicO group peptidase, beta-lactamase class C family [Noviherbaspirillum humi]|uniref:CubicO group peptidase, beta-lactamase class C family n=1 Tax=Noviherbaspirillum humi TaxID=1688639 RepID=A0A239HT15_9BURK|nr:serine hydrolase [Noviherbaspirillum humi]SNS84361.1 CubicO group peptidase, beta-lactamase class C family [Noviherbaspirillum humi]
MSRFIHAAIAALCAAVAINGCGGNGAGDAPNIVLAAEAENGVGTAALPSPSETSAVPIPAGQIEAAIAQLDGLAAGILARSGIPGMAVAVVHGGKTVYAKGFGLRERGKSETVDADTVFQLASVSKPIGATVIANQVTAGVVGWDTPVQSRLPGFTLSDPYVGQQVTIGDLYAHRSGLPDHAGDKLEDLGYGRTEVLQRLRLVPLAPFRITYAYTNFGLTAGAEAVAKASGMDWATLSERAVYQPLGMASTSSRYADYLNRPNRAVTHLLVDGGYIPGPPRDPDAQSPAGGVSSSANDMAKWLRFLLEAATTAGRQQEQPSALLPAITPQMISSVPANANERAGFYGYGFNVGTSASGRVVLSHSGAFYLGAATSFAAIPSADVAIVVLANATPTGMPEALVTQFTDLVQFGSIQRDWESAYRERFQPYLTPVGSLVGAERPTNPKPPQALTAYAGTYRNDYYGPLQVLNNNGTLELRLGPKPTVYKLSHWDGDVFTFPLLSENAPRGSLSKVTFSPGKVDLEYFNDEGLGVFVR